MTSPSSSSCPSRNIHYVFQLGVRNVGGFALQNALKHTPKQFKFIGFATSKLFVMGCSESEDPWTHEIGIIPDEIVQLVWEKKGLDFDFGIHSNKVSVMSYSDLVKDVLPKIQEFLWNDKKDSSDQKQNLCIVDTTPSETNLPFLLKCRQMQTPQGKQQIKVSLALANKAPLYKSTLEEFQQLNQPQTQLGARATVGAGLPVIWELKKIWDSGNSVWKLQGCFSGTLGHLCTRLMKWEEGGKKWEKFSEIILDLHGMGATEPDPRIDLGGLDVAKKVMILARLSGLPVQSLDDKAEVKIDGVLDLLLQSSPDADVDGKKWKSKEVYDNLTSPNTTPNQFLEMMQPGREEALLLNEVVQRKFKTAQSRGKVVRFVGMFETDKKPMISVGLQELDPDSDLAKLEGAGKMVLLEKFEGTEVVKVIGGGAGGQNAANDVFRDMQEMAGEGGGD